MQPTPGQESEAAKVTWWQREQTSWGKERDRLPNCPSPLEGLLLELSDERMFCLFVFSKVRSHPSPRLQEFISHKGAVPTWVWRGSIWEGVMGREGPVRSIVIGQLWGTGKGTAGGGTV